MVSQKEAKQIIKICIENKEPLMLVGSPGIGKTDIINQVAKELEADLYVSHAVTCDPTDYKGMPYSSYNEELNRPEAHFLPFNDLQKLIDAKKPTIFFLDDFGQSTPAVQAACMQLVLGRRVNGFKVSDYVVFIAATNERKDKAGVMGILEPVKSRFIILKLEINVDEWIEWAINNNVRPEIISFIRFRPSLLNNFVPTLDITNTSNPRTVVSASRHMNYGYSKNELIEVISGCCGENFTNEFMAFLKIYQEIPKIEVIINDPSSYKPIKEPSSLYAFCGALAYNANVENFDKIGIVIDKLPIEYQVVTLTEINQRISDISKTNYFRKWVKCNPLILF